MLTTQINAVYGSQTRTRPMARIDQSAVAARIRRIIGEKFAGKQQDLASAIEIQASALSRMLGGHEPFNRLHLIRIERATSARLSWLEWGVEPVYHVGTAPQREEAEFYEGQMLRNYLDRQGIEYSELARRIDKSKNTVQGYFKSKILGKANREAILKALDISYDQLFQTPLLIKPGFAGGGPSVASEVGPDYVSPRIWPALLNDMGLVSIRRMPISARAGYGYHAFYSDAPVEREYVPVSGDRLMPGVAVERHVIVEVNGDSMEPVMEHGYEVLAYEMSEGQYPSLGKFVLVDFRDELTIKRLVGIDWVANTITLRSENGGAELRLPMSEIRRVYHVYDYYKARL